MFKCNAYTTQWQQKQGMKGPCLALPPPASTKDTTETLAHIIEKCFDLISILEVGGKSLSCACLDSYLAKNK